MANNQANSSFLLGVRVPETEKMINSYARYYSAIGLGTVGVGGDLLLAEETLLRILILF
jgi:hypothetical protein